MNDFELSLFICVTRAIVNRKYSTQTVWVMGTTLNAIETSEIFCAEKRHARHVKLRLTKFVSVEEQHRHTYI